MKIWVHRPPIAYVHYLPHSKQWAVYSDKLASSFHDTEWRALRAKAAHDRYARMTYREEILEFTEK